MKHSIRIISITLCAILITIFAPGIKVTANTTKNSDFLITNGVITQYIGAVNVNKILDIPDGVTAIGKTAFTRTDWDISKDGCLSLCIPKNVIMNVGAFSDCVPMNITFEVGRILIEDGAFLNAGNLNKGKMSVSLPSTIKTIGEKSFYKSFYSEPIILNLNEGLETVEAYALAGTKCHLPSTVKYLGDGALSEGWYDTEYMKTKTIYLPESLEVIGDYCVYMERNCGIIKIPASVKKIGEGAFGFPYDTYTPGFDVAEGNKFFKSDENNWLFSKDGKRLLYALSYTGDITVPKGVEYCGADSIHNSPTSDVSARNTYFPATLKKINRDAFYCNSAYFTGDAPDVIVTSDSFGVGQICDLKISNLYVLKGKKQEYIEKLHVLEENTDCVTEYTTISDTDNCFIIVKGKVYGYTGNGGIITLPKGITRIAEDAFRGNLKITGVIIPKGVTSIGKNAFINCNNLKTITIPATVKKIGDNAFEVDGCIGLQFIGKSGSFAEKYAKEKGYKFRTN